MDTINRRPGMHIMLGNVSGGGIAIGGGTMIQRTVIVLKANVLSPPPRGTGRTLATRGGMILTERGREKVTGIEICRAGTGIVLEVLRMFDIVLEGPFGISREFVCVYQKLGLLYTIPCVSYSKDSVVTRSNC